MPEQLSVSHSDSLTEFVTHVSLAVLSSLSRGLPKSFAVWRVTNHYRLQHLFAKNSLFKQTQLLLNDAIVINLFLSQPESTKITLIYT